MRNQILWTTLVVALLIGGIGVLLIDRSYYPVLQTTMPDGVTLTFINRPLNIEEGCRNENEIVEKLLKQKCPRCLIKLTICPQVLEPEWHDAMTGHPVANFAVHTEKQVILITAPEPVAGPTCAAMAAEINQLFPAYCTPPR